jgi:hypothetical protein
VCWQESSGAQGVHGLDSSQRGRDSQCNSSSVNCIVRGIAEVQRLAGCFAAAAAALASIDADACMVLPFAPLAGPRLCRSNVSLVVLVMEGTRGIEFMFGIILSVVVANWVAHHIHHDGVYESELERIGNLYFLRDEPPHRWACLWRKMWFGRLHLHAVVWVCCVQGS